MSKFLAILKTIKWKYVSLLLGLQNQKSDIYIKYTSKAQNQQEDVFVIVVINELPSDRGEWKKKSHCADSK